MTDNSAQLTFCELISRHGVIQVPLIQRDYAQGRTDQEEVREEFLNALHQALCLSPDSQMLPLNLDFVYGTVEVESPRRFQPLDGQQRLTTLFLLHWYLSWRDGCSDAFQVRFAHTGTSRFGYQVRPSSAEFFDALVVFTPDCSPDDIEEVSALIADQPWNYRNWRLDPTIQSSLTMLDAIHEKFRDFPGLYARLIDNGRPAITFQLLDLNNFGLSDDLYIKMNARGKPLTEFETFKARYEQKLLNLYGDESRCLDGYKISLAEFFARQMDTRWADFFWPYRDKDSHIFDTAVMNLFRMVLIITRPLNDSEFLHNFGLLRNHNNKSTYSFFHQRDWLDKPFSEMLMDLLEIWSEGGKDFACQLPDVAYFDEKAIFEKIISAPEDLGYEEIVQFSAYAQFLKTHQKDIEPEVIRDWMRVVFNLSVNTEYNRPADMFRSLSSLVEMAPQMTNVVGYLADKNTVIGGFNQQQVAEEQLKARLMLVDEKWRSLIEHAEAHPYFRGQIGFLLRFSGVNDDSKAEGDSVSSASETQRLQTAFISYYDKASMMFERSGLIDLGDARWERALLALGDYLLYSRSNHSFLVNPQNDPASWKRLLRGAASGSETGGYLQMLWDQLSVEENIEMQLDRVIDDAECAESWRVPLVRTPKAIAYCRKRMLRHSDKGQTYLLSKSRMNGAHVELFTYCFYINILKPAEQQGRLQSLYAYYLESFSADVEPGIRLWCKDEDNVLQFFLYSDSRMNGYSIRLLARETLTEAQTKSLESFGFNLADDVPVVGCAKHDIDDFVFSLDNALAK